MRTELIIKNSITQLMEIGATTEPGQHVRNIVEEVVRLGEEPATTLLQHLEEKTVKVSLLSLEVATAIHVQVGFSSFSSFYRFMIECRKTIFLKHLKMLESGNIAKLQ